MLTQNKIKFIKSLEQKKYRKKNGFFVVEGEKMVTEVVKSSFIVDEIFCTPDFSLDFNQQTRVSEKELKKISQLKTPNKALALVHLPNTRQTKVDFNGLILMLEDIQDPGNLGTIIRTAAWYGIQQIICSPDTVDAFNPKVVQATMGGLFNVNILYTPLLEFIKNRPNTMATFGATLNGTNIYSVNLPQKGVIVMGNESKGISPALENQLDKTLKLPAYPEENNQVESLNVSVATALICAEFRRQAGK